MPDPAGPSDPRARQRERGLYNLVAHTIALLPMLLLYRARMYRFARLPDRGPVLLVANHQSYIDPPLIAGLMSGRYAHSVAREGLFRVPVLSWIITRLSAFPIREGGRPDPGAIREMLARLEAGRMVLIFPEGARSHDGRLRTFKRGAALVISKAKCPVVPVAVEGCADAWPRGGLPRLFGARVATACAEPIEHDELMKDGPDEALRRLEREVDALRLRLRAELRRQTHGVYPPPGPADEPGVGASD